MIEQSRRKGTWHAWCAWCAEHGYQPLPAAPAAVAAYLSKYALQGSPASMVRRIRAVIGDAHRDAGQTNPTTHEGVRRVLRGEYEFAALIAETAKSEADGGWKAAPLPTGAIGALIAKTARAEFEADSGRTGDASNCSTSCSEVEQGVVRGGVEEHAMEQDDTWETWDL